jgi:hypothetical protein
MFVSLEDVKMIYESGMRGDGVNDATKCASLAEEPKFPARTLEPRRRLVTEQLY